MFQRFLDWRRLTLIQQLPWQIGFLLSFLLVTVFHVPLLIGVIVALLGLLGAYSVRLISPIPQFQAVGGSYTVGIRRTPGDPRRQMPPIVAYYPTSVAASSEPEQWVPHDGDVRYLHGLAAYANTPYLLLRHFAFVTMRCTRNAAPIPLLVTTTPSSTSSSSTTRSPPPTAPLRPIIVMSHGLSANAQLYSCLAMDCASRGAVVICIEHQDGSSSFARSGEGPSLEFTPHYRLRPYEDEVALREGQLGHRTQEMLNVLREVGNGVLLRHLCFTRKEVDLALAYGTIPVTLMGHSFGGATVANTIVSLLASAEPSSSSLEQQQRQRSPITAAPPVIRDPLSLSNVKVVNAVCFDMWHVPLTNTLCTLRSLGTTSTTTSLLPPLLLLESQEWQRVKENVAFQREWVAAYNDKYASLLQLQQQQHGRHHLPVPSSPVKQQALHGMSAVTGVSLYGDVGCLVEETKGTDHLSICDVSVLSPVVSRRKYVRGKPRQQITYWARRALQHVGNTKGPHNRDSTLRTSNYL